MRLGKQEGAIYGEYIIPSKINGEHVTEIGQDAFKHRRDLISVTIPSSVIRIESYAFFGCANITAINFAEGLQHIEDWAFLGCYKLARVWLPRSIVKIGNHAFPSNTQVGIRPE